jgi:hypothetical protein
MLQSAFGFDKETKMGYLCKAIGYSCAYIYALHLDHLKEIHSQTIALVNNVSLNDYHNCMY